MRMTRDMDTESWAFYGPDGNSIYYLCETNGEIQVRMFNLDQHGMPLTASKTICKKMGYISSLSLGKNCLFLTSDCNKRIFNLYRMEFDGGSVAQLTNTFTDILSIAPNPDGSVFFASIYQNAEEKLYAFSKEKFEKIDHPELDLRYLSNSFETADKIIPQNLKKEQIADSTVSPNMEKIEPEVSKEKQEPKTIPPIVTHLEITQASNIVVLQWLTTQEEQVEKYRVYRSTSSEGPFTYIGSASNLKTGSFTDYSVEPGKIYYYYVTAQNKLGESNPSSIVSATPIKKLVLEDYHFRLSPDVLLFLAGYDSSFGFVGGGIVEMSDLLGENRIGIIGDTIPSVRTGVEINYEFSQWRTTVDFDFYYYQNFFRILDLQTGNIVDEYRNNENGFDLNLSYPFDVNTRLEYGIGTQRFQGTPLYLQFSEGISNFSQNSDQWDVANYYRLSLVQDRRKATQFWPSSGYAFNFTLLNAIQFLDSNVSFVNLVFETQVFADFGFLNHLVWANRLIGMTSQGPNPQTFFIGQDAPFQAFFTTIRGYGSNTYFGSNLALWNTELRYPLV